MVVRLGVMLHRRRRTPGSHGLAVDLDALWDFGDPAASERRLASALAGAVGTDAAVLRTQVARALGLQRRFAEASAILSTVNAGDSALVATHLDLERGRILNSGGAPAASRPHFLGALQRAEAAGLEFLAADAAHMLAIIEPGDAAVPWVERALAIARSGR